MFDSRFGEVDNAEFAAALDSFYDNRHDFHEYSLVDSQRGIIDSPRAVVAIIASYISAVDRTGFGQEAGILTMGTEDTSSAAFSDNIARHLVDDYSKMFGAEVRNTAGEFNRAMGNVEEKAADYIGRRVGSVFGVFTLELSKDREDLVPAFFVPDRLVQQIRLAYRQSVMDNELGPTKQGAEVRNPETERFVEQIKQNHDMLAQFGFLAASLLMPPPSKVIAWVKQTFPGVSL